MSKGAIRVTSSEAFFLLVVTFLRKSRPVFIGRKRKKEKQFKSKVFYEEDAFVLRYGSARYFGVIEIVCNFNNLNAYLIEKTKEAKGGKGSYI